MRVKGKINEECAVFGVNLTTEEAAGVTYNGLLSLQHRGQEGAGIAVAHQNSIVCRKDTGLVSEVFSGSALTSLPQGKTAVGHTRYSTTGQNKKENTGPFVTEFLTGRIATAHNGNITNAKEIREMLRGHGLCFGATSDSEVLSSLIAFTLTQKRNVLAGVAAAAELLQGAFSVVVACGDGKLIALRDPTGYRPLCIGQNASGFAVASESAALDSCGFAFVRDVRAGEIIVFENGKIASADIKLRGGEAGRGLCVFEYVYFARPDSVIDGLSVYEARRNMGRILAEEWPADADIVCGVPDSGLEAASGYSAASGLTWTAGFVKNRYIGRSFIYPTQTERAGAVKLKLNPLAASIKGKRVILVDDSIVRGTTSERIVKSLKNAGAKEVHLRVSSPPFRYRCHYGTDIDDEEKLIANRMTEAEICRQIGADSLGYISMAGLQKACEKCARPLCTACFTGGGQSKVKKDVLEG